MTGNLPGIGLNKEKLSSHAAGRPYDKNSTKKVSAATSSMKLFPKLTKRPRLVKLPEKKHEHGTSCQEKLFSQKWVATYSGVALITLSQRLSPKNYGSQHRERIAPTMNQATRRRIQHDRYRHCCRGPANRRGHRRCNHVLLPETQTWWRIRTS